MHPYLRTAIQAAIASVTLLVVALASRPAGKDFISFWTAGQLVASHHDPYQGSAVFAIESSQGFLSPKPLIMRNPPWAVPLVYPLGFVTARIGLTFWMVATLGSILLCLRVFPVAPQDRIVAFCFAPVYACFASGQSSAFLLLGFCLFVKLRRSQPFLSGTSLALMAIKPHLFLVLGPVLLLDFIFHRKARELAGAVTALISASAAATLLYPRIWSHYFAMLQTSSLDTEFLQTPAYLLRHLVAPTATWVQFVPAIAGTIWGIRSYLQKRRTWDWKADAMPLILVSLLTAPYAWVTDEIILLPALLLAIANPLRARHAATLFLVINATVFVMLIAQLQLSSGAYIWTSTAWAGLYFYNRKPAPTGEGTYKAHLAQV